MLKPKKIEMGLLMRLCRKFGYTFFFLVCKGDYRCDPWIFRHVMNLSYTFSWYILSASINYFVPRGVIVSHLTLRMNCFSLF